MAAGWAAVREGFAFLKGRKVLQSTFTIDIVAMVFGMPRALFPVLAITQFHRGEEIVGFLFAAPALGAFIGAATTGWVGRIRHQGWAVILAVGVWGAGIAAFGLVGANLWLGYLCLAVAGAADVISAVFRNTILQLTVPEHLRGRLFGIHILVVTGGPQARGPRGGAGRHRVLADGLGRLRWRAVHRRGRPRGLAGPRVPARTTPADREPA